MSSTPPEPNDVNYHPILVPTALWAAFREAIEAHAVQLQGHRERRRRELSHDSARRESGS